MTLGAPARMSNNISFIINLISFSIYLKIYVCVYVLYGIQNGLTNFDEFSGKFGIDLINIILFF